MYLVIFTIFILKGRCLENNFQKRHFEELFKKSFQEKSQEVICSMRPFDKGHFHSGHFVVISHLEKVEYLEEGCKTECEGKCFKRMEGSILSYILLLQFIYCIHTLGNNKDPKLLC